MNHPDVSVMRLVVDPADPASATLAAGLRFTVSYHPDGTPATEPIVLYMLDRHRLSGMFNAARNGATDDDLILALDAAALDNPVHDPEATEP